MEVFLLFQSKIPSDHSKCPIPVGPIGGPKSTLLPIIIEPRCRAFEATGPLLAICVALKIKEEDLNVD